MKKCLICGQASLPGTKLCADCSSARKRAFAATVTQPLLAAASARTGKRLLKLSQSVAATARRSAERSLTAKSTPPPSIAAPTSQGRRATWMVAMIAAALVVTATFAARHVFVAPKVEPAIAAEQSAPPVPTPVSEVVPVPLKTFTAKPGLTAPIADPAVKSAAEPPSTRIDAAKRAATRPRMTPTEVTPPPAEPAPIVQTLAVAPPPPTPVREAPRPDPAQQFNDSLARCTGGLFDRIVCDQRVRAQFCEGQWGQVPQCPNRAPNDHGQ